MYVCLCNAITDDQIRQEVNNGARSVADISHALGVGTCCGSCLDFARTLIEQSSSLGDLAAELTYAA